MRCSICNKDYNDRCEHNPSHNFPIVKDGFSNIPNVLETRHCPKCNLHPVIKFTKEQNGTDRNFCLNCNKFMDDKDVIVHSWTRNDIIAKAEEDTVNVYAYAGNEFGLSNKEIGIAREAIKDFISNLNDLRGLK